MWCINFKARNEAMIARYKKWLTDHPNASPSEAKAAFVATLTEDDRDFLLEHFLTTDADATKILKN
jgi:hypothetical protein